MTKKLSVIVPVYNEGAGVWSAFDAINKVCQSQLGGWEAEIIFVDDGSQDDSFLQLESICRKHVNVAAIRLAANRGAQRAIRAGLEHASGDAACFIPCDLQEPPELIPRMLQSLTDSTPLVFAIRNAREDSWTSRLLSRCFHLLARLLISRNLPDKGIGTFLLGPPVLSALRQYRERNSTLGGLLMTMGFPYASIPYDRTLRQTGSSKWTLAKRLELFVNYFVGYSYAPIRMMSWLGIIVAMLGMLWAMVVVANWLFSSPPPGWTALFSAILVLSGIQMAMTGVIGEYLWRTLDEVRARPLYFIDRIVNDPKAAENSVDSGLEAADVAAWACSSESEDSK